MGYSNVMILNFTFVLSFFLNKNGKVIKANIEKYKNTLKILYEYSLFWL